MRTMLLSADISPTPTNARSARRALSSVWRTVGISTELPGDFGTAHQGGGVPAFRSGRRTAQPGGGQYDPGSWPRRPDTSIDGARQKAHSRRRGRDGVVRDRVDVAAHAHRHDHAVLQGFIEVPGSRLASIPRCFSGSAWSGVRIARRKPETLNQGALHDHHSASDFVHPDLHDALVLGAAQRPANGSRETPQISWTAPPGSAHQCNTESRGWSVRPLL